MICFKHQTKIVLFFSFSGPLASIFFVADAYPPRRDELLLEIKFSRGVFSQLQPLVKVVG
jgi:hypothetical protein